MADKINYDLVSQDGKSVGSVELEPNLFASYVNKTAVHEVIRQQRASWREGNASTISRSEMKGGAKKPWKQKHTGRARAGCTISPLWVGGAIVFGPKPRKYNFSLNRNVKFQALTSALTDKATSKDICVVDSISISKPSAKEAQSILTNLKVTGSVLVVLDKLEDNFVEKVKSFRNIPGVKVLHAEIVNVFDVVNSNKILCSKQGLAALTKRYNVEPKAAKN